ncbi:YobI family P-loop NTPase [Listeria booriae]|uniref:YobI family P-loop NTPase n=1 Tax=Listeria booriae TaxID=1552123 RepID=UPI001626C6AE|nr:hypothetical protein [Listeria booriae]MBC1513937.1 hypothetical protein [Listeria booriae]MBC6153034.1 hypothetical protein [Listeria booriae]MBC6307353.1 hypothetical protein [Listeria booriae]
MMGEEQEKKMEEQVDERKLLFFKLTPEKDVDISGYEDALDFALNDIDIKNVAISGIYSSGKSSVIETYKDQKKDKKFLHISLGYYRSDENSENTKKKVETIPEKGESVEIDKEKNPMKWETEDRLLEGKILNQLLHQIESKKIPQTIFKVKRSIEKKNIVLLCFLIMTGIALFLSLLNYKVWTKYITDIFNFNIWGGVQAICFVLLMALLSCLLYKTISMQLNKTIIKNLSIKGTNFESNIEVFKESTESYFDKYLNDVIYLFDNCDADVIVFEDIDRFENSSIFQKLKEINTLVNNRAESEKKLTFLYLLRDDMFLSKDRTKFFDFIVPIIPVIDASNSYEKLKELLEHQSVMEMFDENYLQKLSLYIDDMRLVKNIINEFMIYHNKINTINLNANKLLALITYKNIFPKDFSELQLNSGLIFNLFEKRSMYIDEGQKALSAEIQALRSQIEQIKKERLISLDELEALYLSKNLRINGKSIDKFNSKTELVAEMKISGAKIEEFLSNYKGYYSVTVEGVLSSIHEKTEFIERKRYLEERLSGDFEHLESQISDLKEKQSTLRFAKIRDIITEEDIKNTIYKNTIGETDSFEYIKRNEYYPLIYFLIRNGYIDKDYSDYMTYFYENSISISDKLYLRSITDESPLEWTYPIINKRKVADRLSEDDFRRIESLNIDISRFLIKNKEDYKKQVVLLFNLLSSQNEIEYIVELYKQFNNNLRINLMYLCFKHWRKSFSLIINNEEITRADKEYILKTVLENLNIDEVSQVNENNFINKYLENSKTFLGLLENMSNQLISNLNSIDLKFVYIDFVGLKDTCGEMIYENNLYKINFHNIKDALECFYRIGGDDISHRNYTLIKSYTSSLEKYVESNIDLYVSEYLNFSEEKIQDDEMYIYDILNNEAIDLEKRKKYISFVETRNLNLSEIETLELKEIVIKSDLAIPNEENIVHYFIQKNEQWSAELISFSNENKDIFDFDYSKITNNYSDEERRSFFGQTVQCFDLKNKIYKKILVAMKYSYTDGFSIPDIPQDKMQILIEIRLVRMTEQCLASLREFYKMNIVKLFIKQNIDEYLDIISDMYDYDELIDVLKIKDLAVETKMRVVDNIREVVSIDGQGFSEELMIYILDNKYDDNDFEYLISQYDNYSEPMKNIIYQIAVDGIGRIISSGINLNNSLLEELLSDINISVENRALIFSKNIKQIDIYKFREIFNMLDLGDYISLLDGSWPKFEINETNENILCYLKKTRMISDYVEEQGEFRARARSKMNRKI